MSYGTIAAIEQDQELLKRVTACVAVEQDPQPDSWVRSNTWRLAAQPGWAAKYEAAKLNGVNEPGAREDVITDADILAAVQSLRGGNTGGGA